MRNFGESSVDLQLKMWIDNARKRADTIDLVTDQVKDLFLAEGIDIPFPQREITVRPASGDKDTAPQSIS